MRPIFYNSALIAAPEWAVLKGGGWKKRQLKVRYGVFHHDTFGPVLIDTGYTEHTTTAKNRSFALKAYSQMLRPRLDPTGQLRTVGIDPEEVQIVIVTHFHADHVSGLRAFPNARFIASGAAWERVSDKTTRQNLRHGVFTELLPDDFDQRLIPIESKPTQDVDGLPQGFDLFDDQSVIAVPLPGHADGHFGVYFRACDLLYATDTQWLIDALPTGKRPRLLSKLVSEDAQAAAQSADAVSAFKTRGGQVLLCHDDGHTMFDAPHGST